MGFNWLIALGLFVVASLLDAVFALYTVSVIKTQPIRAASLSFVTYMLEAIGVVNYVDNRWYLIPLAFGAFTGSYVVVKWEALKKARNPESKAKE